MSRSSRAGPCAGRPARCRRGAACFHIPSPVSHAPLCTSRPKDACVTWEPIVTFQSGSSDEGSMTIERNLGNYLSKDFWRLSRLGKNIKIYEISKKCATSIGWKDFEGFFE